MSHRLRRAPFLFALLAAALAGTALPAAASVYRVDDSGTIVGQPLTPMRWRKLVPGRAADNTVEGSLDVALRLNLSAWQHRPARLYLVLAPTDGLRLQASWHTQGRLLPGSVRSGGRTLVWQGAVQEPFLEETLRMDLLADGRTLDRAQSLQFYFEIELSP